MNTSHSTVATAVQEYLSDFFVAEDAPFTPIGVIITTPKNRNEILKSIKKEKSIMPLKPKKGERVESALRMILGKGKTAVLEVDELPGGVQRAGEMLADVSDGILPTALLERESTFGNKKGRVLVLLDQEGYERFPHQELITSVCLI